MSRIVTGDKPWAHHYELETKGNQWSDIICNHQEKKKFKTTPSAGKLMIAVFWDTDGVILVDVMGRGDTINSDAYIKPSKN